MVLVGLVIAGLALIVAALNLNMSREDHNPKTTALWTVIVIGSALMVGWLIHLT